MRSVFGCILHEYTGSAALAPRAPPSRPIVTAAEGRTVSAAPEQPVPSPPAVEQPVLLRAVEFGPPPEAASEQPGWRSTMLAELPELTCVPGVPVLVMRPGTDGPAPAPARRTRTMITEAQARGLASVTARAVLETLEGRRPMQQLTGMLTERALAAVDTMRRGGLRWPIRRATLGTVHVYLPCRDAVEACVVFRCDRRSRALALRFELQRRRWVATAIRIG
jgi:hypothetical protein